MINGTQVTIVGNVGADPERRSTGSGTIVTTIAVAVAERKYDRQSSKYVDAGTTWYRVNIWRDMAENACASLRKGMRVIVIGNLAAREWETQDSHGIAWEITADAIGPDLAFASADVKRVTRTDAPPADDPQGAPPESQADTSAGTGERKTRTRRPAASQS